MKIINDKMMSNNTCIRVMADPVQIRGCRESIDQVRKPLNQLSKVLNLSGNEVRLKILFLLYKEGKMCPCDLSDVLEMTVPAISQHLRKMKDGGLILDKKVGQTIFYSLINEKTGILIPILENIMQPNNIQIKD